MTELVQAGWELKLATILVPTLAYLIMALLLTYPQTERVQSCVSTREMWREATRPLFVLLFCCMWFTAAVELGPDQWFPAVMGALVPHLQGVLFLVYTSGLVFLLRTFGSSIAHQSPIGTLLVGSAFAAVGLYWLGGLQAGASVAWVAFLAATLFGIGKSFLWPTMLGVTSEQFPRGGALTISLMGGAGMASVAAMLPIMGARMDHYGSGAALQMMAIIGAVIALIFAGVYLYFKRHGGYRRAAIGKPAWVTCCI
jgi:hypothetical protein